MLRRLTVTLSCLSLLLPASLLGSERQVIAQRYQLEKRQFSLDRQFRISQINPALKDSADDELLIAGYDSLVQNCYRLLQSRDLMEFEKDVIWVSRIAFQAVSHLTQLLFAESQFDRCADIVNKLLTQTRLPRDDAMSAYLNLGQALQAAGKWDSAVIIFEQSLVQFNPPTSYSGDIFYRLFNLPVHLFRIYTRSEPADSAQMRFDEAIAYYREMIETFPGTVLSVSSWSNLVRLYSETENWESAIEACSHLTDSTGKTSTIARMKIADFYARGLKNPSRALREYRFIEGELSGTDTALKPIILFKRSLVLIGLEQYAESRRTLVELERSFPEYFNVNAAAQYTKARTFELEGNWERAETEYSYLMEQYEASPQALGAYLYLIDRFEESGEARRVEQWSRRAETHYARLSARLSGDYRQSTIFWFQAELFGRQKDWNSALNILEKIYNRFPRTRAASNALARAANIYRAKLNSEETADSLLERLKREVSEVDDTDDISDL